MREKRAGMSRRTPVRWLLLPLLTTAAACTHNVMPKVTPAKVPSVAPPIEARALLLLSPSFQAYRAQESDGLHKWRYHLGEAAAVALSDLVSRSFTRGEVRMVTDSEILQWLTAPADTSIADVLLVPHFEGGGTTDRVFDTVSEARLRLEARTMPGNLTYSWVAAGRTARVLTSRRGLSGNTLEQVLRALSDSLGAHRADLQAARTMSNR